MSLVTRKHVWDSNRPALLQKLARDLKFDIASRGIILSRQRTTKVLIRLDCTDAQADLRLCCSHMAKTGFLMTRLRWKQACSDTEASNGLKNLDLATADIILFRQWITNTLIRLRESAGWSASLLVAYNIIRLCHDRAHMAVTKNFYA